MHNNNNNNKIIKVTNNSNNIIIIIIIIIIIYVISPEKRCPPCFHDGPIGKTAPAAGVVDDEHVVVVPGANDRGHLS